MKTIFLALLVSAFLISSCFAESIKMDIDQKCAYGTDQVMIMSVVKLKGKGTRRLYQIFCKSSGDCNGIEISMDDRSLNMLSLISYNFTPQKIVRGPTSLTLNWNNTIISSNGKKVEFRFKFPNGDSTTNKAIEEVWEGICEL